MTLQCCCLTFAEISKLFWETPGICPAAVSVYGTCDMASQSSRRHPPCSLPWEITYEIYQGMYSYTLSRG